MDRFEGVFGIFYYNIKRDTYCHKGGCYGFAHPLCQYIAI